MAWVFQGSPDKYRIDDYLSQFPVLIYWRTNRYAKQIKQGDRAYVWRSGLEAGAVVIGTVVEEPKPVGEVMYPDALATDLWLDDKPVPGELKTGIRPDEIRLSASDKMVPRSIVKDDPLLGATMLIKTPNGTVFKLSDKENNRLEDLWVGGVITPTSGGAVATEGERQLRSHYNRERSTWLRDRKLEQFMSDHGELYCELCNVKPEPAYPAEFAPRILEIHHRAPLSMANVWPAP